MSGQISLSQSTIFFSSIVAVVMVTIILCRLPSNVDLFSVVVAV